MHALHNAGVKVSGLIFYLSGVITVAFTAALLQSGEDSAVLLNLYWKKNGFIPKSIQEIHKMLQLQMFSVRKVLYSILPPSKQRKQIWSAISDRADVSAL